jgi:glutamine synthetase
VPLSDPANRRIENRLPGADANPYLAMAAALICGWLGIEEQIEPTAPEGGNAYTRPRTLPKTLEEAMERFGACTPVRDLLGEPFFRSFAAIKEAELEAYRGVISSWERDHLLLKV